MIDTSICCLVSRTFAYKQEGKVKAIELGRWLIPGFQYFNTRISFYTLPKVITLRNCIKLTKWASLIGHNAQFKGHKCEPITLTLWYFVCRTWQHCLHDNIDCVMYLLEHWSNKWIDLSIVLTKLNWRVPKVTHILPR